MAARYFRNTGNTSWNVTTNWSATDGGASVGAIPTSSDDVFLTALSGNLNMNAAGVCLSFTCTGYLGTLSGASGLTVSGNITLSSGMTISVTGSLLVNAAATLTSALKAWTGILNLSASVVYTLTDNWNVNNLTLGGSAGTRTINGNNIFMSSLVATRSSDGTTAFTFNGSGTWSGTGTLGNNVTIDTLGTLTFGTDLRMGGTPAPKLKYVRGGISIPGGGVFRIIGEIIFDTDGISFDTITYIGSSQPAYNITILSKLGANQLTMPVPSVTTGTTSFLGTAGFEVNTLSGTGYTTLFTPSILYRVKTALNILTDTSATRLIKSTVNGIKATLTLDNGAICSAGYVNFQDIDASGGRKINTFNGTVTNSNNVESYIDPVITIAKSFAA